VTQAWPLLEVKGTAYQCGFQHGAQAGDLVRRTLAYLDYHFKGRRAELARAARGLLPRVEQVSPNFVQEVQGVADGARLSFDDVWLIQCRSEAEGCTAFAFAATAVGSPLAGQNQDLEPELAEVALLLRVSPDDERPSCLMWTFAGQLGYAGMNDRGLAMFHTALYGFTPGPGIPKQVLKRMLLEQGSTGEALAWIARHQSASAANFVLCDTSGGLADVEVTPEGCGIDAGKRGEVLHSNHCITPELSGRDRGAPADSADRLARMRALVRSDPGCIDTASLRNILADHHEDPAGICRHGANGWYSIAGYIAEPAAHRLHVRKGPGCLQNWATYQV
jgi:isopenicillin-N N-acyltransferase-like protein